MNTLTSLAVRNVARNPRRSLVTLGSVLLGVTAMLVLEGFIGGFLRLIVDDIVLGQTGALQVHTAGYVAQGDALPLAPSIPYAPALLARIQAVPGVTAVTGRIRFSGLVSNGLAQTMFVGRGVDLASEARAVPRAGFDILPGGRMLLAGDHAQAVLGGELARAFHAVPAGERARAMAEHHTQASEWVDRVTLASASPRGRANSLDVAVEGLSESGLPHENKNVVTVPLSLAQELLGLQGQVTELAVAVDELGHLEQVATALREVLGPGYEVHTWTQLQPFVNDTLYKMRFVLGLIGLILFVIILTGILNATWMSVFERVREIGTLLALGMRRRQVLTLFLLEASLVGGLGGGGGAVLGCALVRGLAEHGVPMEMILHTGATSLLRPELHPVFVLLTLTVAVAGALAAAAWPAWKASRLRPVEALRSV